MQQDNNSDFPDVELLTHLAPAQESEQHAMETGAGSTASVEASNGHIPSDVHLTEEHQDPPNCKVMGQESSRVDNAEIEPEQGGDEEGTSGSPNEEKGEITKGGETSPLPSNPTEPNEASMVGRMEDFIKSSHDVMEHLDASGGIGRELSMTYNTAEWVREIIANEAVKEAMGNKTMDPAMRLGITITNVFNIGNKHLKRGNKAITNEIMLVATENAGKFYETRKAEYIATAEQKQKQMKSNHKTHMSKMEMVYNSKITALKNECDESTAQQLRNQHEKHQKNQEKQSQMMDEVMQIQLREQEKLHKVLRNQQGEHEHLTATLENVRAQKRELENDLTKVQQQLIQMSEENKTPQKESKYAQHNEGYRIQNEGLKLEVANIRDEQARNELEIANIRDEHARNVNKYNNLAQEFNKRGATLRFQMKTIEEMGKNLLEKDDMLEKAAQENGNVKHEESFRENNNKDCGLSMVECEDLLKNKTSQNRDTRALQKNSNSKTHTKLQLEFPTNSKWFESTDLSSNKSAKSKSKSKRRQKYDSPPDPSDSSSSSSNSDSSTDSEAPSSIRSDENSSDCGSSSDSSKSTKSEKKYKFSKSKSKSRHKHNSTTTMTDDPAARYAFHTDLVSKHLTRTSALELKIQNFDDDADRILNKIDPSKKGTRQKSLRKQYKEMVGWSKNFNEQMQKAGNTLVRKMRPQASGLGKVVQQKYEHISPLPKGQLKGHTDVETVLTHLVDHLSAHINETFLVLPAILFLNDSYDGGTDLYKRPTPDAVDDFQALPPHMRTGYAETAKTLWLELDHMLINHPELAHNSTEIVHYSHNKKTTTTAQNNDGVQRVYSLICLIMHETDKHKRDIAHHLEKVAYPSFMKLHPKLVVTALMKYVEDGLRLREGRPKINHGLAIVNVVNGLVRRVRGLSNELEKHKVCPDQKYLDDALPLLSNFYADIKRAVDEWENQPDVSTKFWTQPGNFITVDMSSDVPTQLAVARFTKMCEVKTETAWDSQKAAAHAAGGGTRNEGKHRGNNQGNKTFCTHKNCQGDQHGTPATIHPQLIKRKKTFKVCLPCFKDMCNSKKDLPLTTFYEDGSPEFLKYHARESKKGEFSSAQRLKSIFDYTSKLKDGDGYKQHVARVTNGLEAKSKCYWAPHLQHLNNDSSSEESSSTNNNDVLAKIQAMLTQFKPTQTPKPSNDDEAIQQYIQKFLTEGNFQYPKERATRANGALKVELTKEQLDIVRARMANEEGSSCDDDEMKKRQDNLARQALQAALNDSV